MARNSIAEIAAVVARKHNMSKAEATDIVTTFFRTISEGLHDDRITKVRGLGTFKLTTVKARESVNVNTGERVVIEPHDKVTFVPDSSMKDLVNKPFAEFTTVVVNDGVNFDSIDAAAEAEENKMKTESEATSESADDSEETDDEMAVSEEENKSVNEDDEPTQDEESSPSESPEKEESPVEKSDENEPSSINSVIDSNVIEEQKVSDSPAEDVSTEGKGQLLTEQSDASKQVETREEVEEKAVPISPLIGINETQKDKENPVTEEEPDKEDKTPVAEQARSEESSVEEKEEVDSAGPKPTQEVDNGEDANKEECVSKDYFDEQMAVCRHRCNRNLVLSAVMLVLGLAVGFCIGYYLMNHKAPAPTKPVIAKAVPAKPKAPAVVDSAKDTTKVVAKAVVKDTVKKSEKKVEKKPVRKGDIDIAKLNSDKRLRYGAYEITGIEKTIRLRKGQTMRSYSNKTLGKDMVVYFQVLNGVDEMEAGDSLMVPKIRLKKKYRK